MVAFLVDSWRSRRWAQRARLRGHFARVARPDPTGMAASLRAARPRDQQGALLAALSGSVVTQSVACKWRGGDARCLHCRLAPETPYHRFWECTSWQSVRTRLGCFAPPPDPLASTGVLPLRMDLWTRLGAAEDVRLDSPVPIGFDAVWLDGSAMDHDDPLLRRAAWAVVWWRDGAWHHAAGPCPGAQTVARAELSALVWAAEAANRPFTAVSDCQYVVRGVRTLGSGDPRRLLEGLHGDLWCRLVNRTVTIRWVRSHRQASEVRLDDVVDWVGNSVADHAAKAAARSLRVPAELRAQRAAALTPSG